ncbi:FtsK/SpoIIIE domain-containing protein [Actinomycetospora lutea]|uniref:FtsK/SpoIIIE domain-containing protein n=1 Tax=Actinomycetospora lutea TaxID=663604 RepID=UPI002366D4C1|nr:FtsK/SpoIIIE domain-containing protein [Actinomycetospora lutea]MDD7942569.1 FtsK/SpoIIIE domain-containing protein [Actinomycetospora lutea]
MREITTARLWRGQTIRTRADVMRTERLHERSRLIRWSLTAGWWAGWLTIMTVWAALYVPALGGVLTLAALAWLALGPWGLLVVALVGALVARLWSRSSPTSWESRVTSRLRRFARRTRYRWSWDDVCAATGVKATDASHRVIVPRLLWVSLGEHVDQLHVQLCAGVTPGVIARQADALASEWCALEVRVLAHPTREGWVLLRVVYRDVLADDEDERDNLVTPDFQWVRVGRREDGEPWWLRLMGTHVLIAGLTGAGKSGLVACIIRALAPAIRAGKVRLVGIDPKGGMEYRMVSELFYMLAYGDDEHLVAALEFAADLMRQRAEALGGNVRKLLARMFGDYPLYVILVDELLALTTYIANRDLKDRANAAVRRMLSQGRAPGVVVIGCVQDPRKEVLSFRDMFGYRVALRLDSDVETRMVLSDSAYDRGARCDAIPEACPGMGFVVDEDGGKRQPIKVRADWVSDAELAYLAAEYPAPEQVDVPPLATRNKRSGGSSSGGQAA